MKVMRWLAENRLLKETDKMTQDIIDVGTEKMVYPKATGTTGRQENMTRVLLWVCGSIALRVILMDCNCWYFHHCAWKVLQLALW